MGASAEAKEGEAEEGLAEEASCSKTERLHSPSGNIGLRALNTRCAKRMTRAG